MSRRASRKRATRHGAAPRPARRPAGAAAVRTSSAWKLIPAGIGALLVGGLVALLALSSSTGSGVSGAVGAAAPDFTLRTVDGKRFSLAEQQGRVVVVEFLEPGCPSCTIDVAGLSEAAVQRQGEVSILVADVSGLGPRTLRDYYHGDLGASAELLIAPGGSKVAQTYGVTDLGDTVVIDPGGEVSWRGLWSGDSGRLLEQIEGAEPL